MAITLNGSTGIDTPAIETDSLVIPTQVINGITVGTGGGSVATNTVVGRNALGNNTTGQENTALGSETLFTNTTGNYNLAVGGRDSGAWTPLYSNTTGSSNTAIGNAALSRNTTASNNTAVGYQAGYSNTTGELNTFLGYQAGYSHTTSAYNVFLGYRAGYSYNGSLGSNLHVGYLAGYSSTGDGNTFVGARYIAGGTGCGYSMTTGSKNSIFGAFSGNQGGLDIRTANNYIVLSDGDGNVRGGWSSSTQAFFVNNTSRYTQLDWWNNATQKAAIFWDNDVSRLTTYTNTNGPYLANGGTSWTNSSDERLKNITGEIQNGLSKVCSLRAAEYTWKSDQSAKPQVGLIAQDVLAVLPEIVDVPQDGMLDKDGNLVGMGVDYNGVIPLLVAAIKEQQTIITDLKARIEVLEAGNTPEPADE